MVGYLTRIELRRQWRSVVVLALLVALVVGTVLASVAGARRSRTAFDRYLTELRSPSVFASGDPAALREIADLPFVKATGRIGLAAVSPVAAAPNDFYPMAVSLDGRVPYDYYRVPVVKGRRPDPKQPLEVALGERTARRLHLGLGDTMAMVSYSPAGSERIQSDGGDESQPPDGPHIDLRVVGIVRDPGDIGARGTDLTLTFLTPAFRERFPRDQIGNLADATFVVLRHKSDASRLAAAVRGSGIELDTSFSGDAIRLQATPIMRAIGTALEVFAGVAGLAGLAAIGYAVARLQQSSAADDPVLSALGIGRRRRWTRAVVPAALGVVGGAALGLVVAITASPLFPIGLARRAEPHRGLDVDAPTLLLGALAALVLGLVVVALLGALSGRSALEASAPPRRSILGRRAADAGAPPVVVTGVTMAFGGARATRSTSASATVGVTLGVLGVLSAVVFAASIDRLVHTPSLYGWGWDANLAGADLSQLDERGVDLPKILADPDLSVVARYTYQLPATLDGSPELVSLTEDLKGHLQPVVVRGRAPVGADEIGLGRDTMVALHKTIGDPVRVDLGTGPQTLRFTGVVALPVNPDGGASTAGAFLPAAAATALGAAPACSVSDSCVTNLALRLAPGVRLADIVKRYTDEANQVTVEVPTPPGEVERLRAVERLPWFLAGFLALLAAIAVVYSAGTMVRRRRRDLALLRVIGMSAAQLRTVVAVQVLALTLVGVVVGELVGVILGRQVWRWVTSSVSLRFSPAVPIAALLLIPVATLMITQVAATVSRRSAGRTHAALALRTE